MSMQNNVRILVADLGVFFLKKKEAKFREMSEFLKAMVSKLEELKTNPKEREWKEDFTFIQGADCQFGLIDRYILKSPVPNWDKEIKLSSDAIRQINRLEPKPRFFIICGDMLDAFPYPEEKALRERQLVDFHRIYKDLDPEIPLVCVCGNHDVGDIPTRATVDIYREQFGQDFFIFWVGGVKFLVLNSQYYRCPDNVPEELEKQNSLLDTLAEGPAKHTVAFQHIPYFLKTPDEEDDRYFNISKELRLELLEKLRDAGVRYIFTGHYHRNAGGFYKDVEQVVTSAIGGPLGNDPSGFRIVRVTEQGLTHEYVPVEISSSTDV
ncbi:unnamed protein product [Allacma fusca]|uniref:Calcineurin-like phosphoesterase domain-containing protein n=1 Tax=Allacma fusca TaxID=39272 RepID=A0A8J2LR74_9HEXA|nr:unnamed protein product [Allacma fusca]